MAKIADRLDELQQDKNQGRGVCCVRTVIAYLRAGDMRSAKAVCRNENDKIRCYPDILEFLEENNMAPVYKYFVC